MIGCNAIISFILPGVISNLKKLKKQCILVLFVPALILDNNPAMSGILEAAKLFYQVNSALYIAFYIFKYYILISSVFCGSYVFVTLIIKKHRDFFFGTAHTG